MQDLLTVVDSTKYPLDAFLFLQRGLEFTVQRAHGEAPPPGPGFDPDADQPDRHVSGQMLCLGLRDFALEQYGLLARTVLKSWRLHSCEDFGQLVYAMVNAGMMHKTQEDSLDDFNDVYDFKHAFPQVMQSPNDAAAMAEA